jgi:hypothetical protein
VSPGVYRLEIGVYNPGTGERVAIVEQPAHLIADEDRFVLPEEIEL